MEKTSQYQLNQWAAEDRILREDFNRDNANVEAGLVALGERVTAEEAARQAAVSAEQSAREQAVTSAKSQLDAAKADKTALAALQAQVDAMPFVKLLSFSTELLLKILGIRQDDQKITEEEIHSMIDEGGEAGVIDAQEHTMVKNVFRLDDRAVASLMVPRSEVQYLDLEDTREVNMEKVLNSQHSRLPVCYGGLDDIRGVVTTRLLLKQMVNDGKPNFKVNYEPVLYVPESISGMELLDTFRKSDAALAMVVDEYGAILGLVTPHDVLEAIAGEFKPDAPEDAQIIQKGENCYEVDGLLPIPELKDLLDIDEVPDEDKDRYTTVAGMVIFLLERLPRTGDRVKWDGWEFRVMVMDGRRLDRILITKLPSADDVKEKES